MPIKPMDMQVLLPNIRRAARPENAKLAKDEQSMQQQQIQDKKELKEDQTKVNNLEQKDATAIKNDQKRHEREEAKKKKKKEEEEKKKLVVKDRESKFDMKV
jgi:hypothetical protein